MTIASLHYITQNLPTVPHWEQAEKACLGGVKWVQLRVKNTPYEQWKEIALKTQAVCKRFHAKLIINDNFQLAHEIGADGVHLGKTDPSPVDARVLLGDAIIIGGTANTIDDIRNLHKAGVNYIGCGPYRFTKTKENLSPIVGLEGYKALIKQCREEGLTLPIVGIGGIQLEDVALLKEIGLYGVAVSSMINLAENPTEMASRFSLLTSPLTPRESPLTPKGGIVLGEKKTSNSIPPLGARGLGLGLLSIADKTFSSRLFTGTGKFSSAALMEESLLVSGSELVTVALKRVDLKEREDDILGHLNHPQFNLLPNTSGVRNAKEAVFAAQLAREALETNWLKLEIHPDPKYLMPDPIETLKAAEELVKLGFVVMPYIHADPVLCKRLEEVGVAAVMPLGSPIGSNKGLKTIDFLEIIIEQSRVPVVVDAGIGSPSDAAYAMEIGADAVLVNTAIAVSQNPVLMAKAFKLAVEAGRMAFEAKLAQVSNMARASSPLTEFLNL